MAWTQPEEAEVVEGLLVEKVVTRFPWVVAATPLAAEAAEVEAMLLALIL